MWVSQIDSPKLILLDDTRLVKNTFGQDCVECLVVSFIRDGFQDLKAESEAHSVAAAGDKEAVIVTFTVAEAMAVAATENDAGDENEVKIMVFNFRAFLRVGLGDPIGAWFELFRRVDLMDDQIFTAYSGKVKDLVASLEFPEVKRVHLALDGRIA